VEQERPDAHWNADPHPDFRKPAKSACSAHSATLRDVRRTPGISCEAVPASMLSAGAGMRRHVHSGNHAAESFVSFIPLILIQAPSRREAGRAESTPAGLQ
jgi:hypothetical protein